MSSFFSDVSPKSSLWVSGTVEISGLLVGARDDKTWRGRVIPLARGTCSSVDFDWKIVFDREDRHGDVIGFYHTHPLGPARPSRRDILTMRAWCDCLGKPLLCVIGLPGQDPPDFRGYIFKNHRSRGRKTRPIENRGNFLVFKE